MIAPIPGTLVVWRWGFRLRLVWIDVALAVGQGRIVGKCSSNLV
jgi:hypothetical protein